MNWLKLFKKKKLVGVKGELVKGKQCYLAFYQQFLFPIEVSEGWDLVITPIYENEKPNLGV